MFDPAVSKAQTSLTAESSAIPLRGERLYGYLTVENPRFVGGTPDNTDAKSHGTWAYRSADSGERRELC